MRLLPPLLVLCLLASCSVQAKLTLADESATVDASFSLSAPAKAAWNSLRELDGSLPVDPLDPVLLHKGLGEQSMVSTSANTTSVSFPVPQPKKLVPELRADASSWELVLDRATVKRWAALTTWGASPALDSLLPSPQTRVTEAEYRDLLVYLLGSGVSDSAARALIDASTVQLTVVAPRPVRAAPGATSVNDKIVVYRWPLVRVLALEKPLRLRLDF